MGTPVFAKNILEGLVSAPECQVVCAYTNPDAIRGRGKNLVPSPVKVFAEQHNIPVETPQNFNDDKTIENLESYHADFIIVAAYKMILPKSVLDTPKYECLNIHGSLLPKWRGAAPVQRAILAGDEEIGASIMKIGEGLDDGPYCEQVKFSAIDKSSDEVFDEMVKLSLPILLSSMNKIIKGSIKWIPQNDDLATYAEKLEKRELWANTNDNDLSFYRKVLASDAGHLAKCSVGGKVASITKAKLVDSKLQIVRLKPDGKNELDWDSFVRGIQNVDEEKLKWGPVD